MKKKFEFKRGNNSNLILSLLKPASWEELSSTGWESSADSSESILCSDTSMLSATSSVSSTIASSSLSSINNSCLVTDSCSLRSI